MTTYYVKQVVTQRPTDNVPFIGEALDADDKALFESYAAARKEADGFLGGALIRSADNLTDTKWEYWRDEAAYDAFIAANKTVYEDQQAIFKAHNEDKGITSTSTFNEVDETKLSAMAKIVIESHTFKRV